MMGCTKRATTQGCPYTTGTGSIFVQLAVAPPFRERQLYRLILALVARLANFRSVSCFYPHTYAIIWAMKILIITTNGITSFFKGWPERLQARGLIERGHQVRAITYLGDRDFNSQPCEIIDEVEVRRLKRRDWWSSQLLRELGFGPRPDLVHLHHLSNQFAFEAALICKVRRIPVVMTPHGLFHDPYLVADRDRPFATPARYAEMILTPGQLFRALRRQFKPKRHLKNFLNHSPLLMMNRVIALSEHGRSVLIKLGVKPARIAVVPNALDPGWMNDEPTVLPSALADHTGPLVLYMGQLKYRKGFDLLARAIPAILESCPMARFVFMGHSPIHEAELIRLIQAAGATDRLTLLHSVTEGQKAAIFSAGGSTRRLCFAHSLRRFWHPFDRGDVGGLPGRDDQDPGD